MYRAQVHRDLTSAAGVRLVPGPENAPTLWWVLADTNTNTDTNASTRKANPQGFWPQFTGNPTRIFCLNTSIGNCKTRFSESHISLTNVQERDPSDERLRPKGQ